MATTLNPKKDPQWILIKKIIYLTKLLIFINNYKYNFKFYFTQRLLHARKLHDKTGITDGAIKNM